MTNCDGCRRGMHQDCIGTIECPCYAYAEAHMTPQERFRILGVLEHPHASCPPAESDPFEGDLEHDSGDGGLVDGGRLERELEKQEQAYERQTGLGYFGR